MDESAPRVARLIPLRNGVGEGFSEVLAKEVRPLGIKVTIIEPGGFRTDFAGGSTTIRSGRPECESTVGAVAQFQLAYNGTQPGDPVKAAAIIMHITTRDEPPLRLLLGSDTGSPGGAERLGAAGRRQEVARFERLH